MLLSFNGKMPKSNAAFVADNASVIGSVELGSGSSVWFGAVVRGDDSTITIGNNSNVQDSTTLHSDEFNKITVGEGVTIGHNAVVHGCTIGDNSVVGMNSTVLNGAVIGKNCLIGAGAVVTENKVFPDNSLIIGVPAKAVRQLTEEEIEGNRLNAAHYCELARQYAAEKKPPIINI